MPYECLCKQCGQTFRSDRRDRSFCSRRCKGDWQKVNLTGANNPNWLESKKMRPANKYSLRTHIRHRDKSCQDCGLDHHLHVHHIDGNHAHNSDDNLVLLCKWCHAARHQARDENGIADLILAEHVYKERPLKVCPICGKSFTSPIKRQVHCSVKCKSAHHRSHMKGRKVWNKGINDVSVICVTCGKTFTRSQGRLDAKTGPKFCSKPCQIRYAINRRVAAERGR